MTLQLSMTTPGLLFSTLSLIMTAYTSRFLAITKLIRELNEKFMQKANKQLWMEIHLLRKCVCLIRHMQMLCILALLLSAMSLMLIMLESNMAAVCVFAISLLLLLVSLAIAAREIALSTKALNLSLEESKEFFQEEKQSLPLVEKNETVLQPKVKLKMRLARQRREVKCEV